MRNSSGAGGRKTTRHQFRRPAERWSFYKKAAPETGSGLLLWYNVLSYNNQHNYIKAITINERITVTHVSAAASPSFTLFAKPLLASLRNPFNPFAYLPGSWVLAATLERAVFGERGHAAPTVPVAKEGGDAPVLVEPAQVVARVATARSVAAQPDKKKPARKKLVEPKASAHGPSSPGSSDGLLTVRMAESFVDSIQPSVVGMQ
jgi:hypothetical protein